jgi:peptidoglycan/LPS O-acetylase OafA/YrhL
VIAEASSPASGRATTPPRAPSLGWLDGVKAVALLWIVLNHLCERLAQGAFAGNPAPDWPPLAVRIAQFAPSSGAGIGGLLLAALRDLGWLGDNGVGVFLVASGFGLTYGLIGRGATAALDLIGFYRARAARIYPLWWGAHVAFAVTVLVVGGAPFLDWRFYLSALGVRVTPELFYYAVPAWWYVGLLLQLYLVFPLLWRLLCRAGPAAFLLATVPAAMAIRAAGLFAFSSYLDAWSRGAIFITRLPEFALGMALAAWFATLPDAARRRTAPWTVALGVACVACGIVASFSLAGMTVAPLLMGGGAFVLLGAGLPKSLGARTVLGWIGRHSYALYLVHQPFISALVPAATATFSRIAAGAVGALAAAAAVAPALELAVSRAAAWLRGRPVRALIVAGVAAAALLLADRAVFHFAPQEVYGWGERPSLEPDPVAGWKLRPSRTTRLRWLGYDYRVTANALGFPGPMFPVMKPHGTLRIMTTGDAFTSAEGVDTDESWPRLLQGDLAAGTRRPVEVLNFAVTGYGPNQYAAVVNEYTPRYRPDLVLVELFTNDLEDALVDDAAFRRNIGFGRPPPYGLRAALTLQSLRAFLHGQAREAYAWLRRRPSPEVFYGDPVAFDREWTPRTRAASAVAARVAEIERATSLSGGRVAIVMIPSSLQVCAPRDLGYPLRGFALRGPRYDDDFPQRTFGRIAAGLGIPALDLRPALRAAPRCPYMPANMHWTVEGHRIVADRVARFVENL